MKIKKLILSLLCTSMLVACTSNTPVINEPVFEPTDPVDQNNINQSITLADDISKEIDGNLLFSPLSLNLALGLLVEGANNQTKEALETYLNTQNYKDFSKYYMYYISHFNEKSDDEYLKFENVFEIANGLWTRKDITLLDSYKEAINNYYLANIDSLDFTKQEECAKIINDYCKKKTHQMIPEIVKPEMFTKDLAAILMNTIYFESSWPFPWNVEDEKALFTNVDGSTSQVQYINTKDANAYYENEYATAFAYRYMNNLQFIGILPKDEGDFNLIDLHIEELLHSPQEFTDLSVRMPKLNYESTIPLKDILSNHGLSSLFDQADFSRMCENDLAVSNIFQKTKIELDENGTKVAAASIVLMNETALWISDPIYKEVNLNRPFAYLIYDPVNEQIIFIGKVNSLA